MTSNEFGRVDQDNNVFVIDNGAERQIGQYPNVSADAALVYYTRKFADLEAQVRTLEQRIAAGISDSKSLKMGHDALVLELKEPKVLGNIASLRDRLAKLQGPIGAAAEMISAQRDAAFAIALAEKEEIAARAEAMVHKMESINWKKSAAEMTELFDKWQTLQKNGPKIPKSKTDPIWKRFSQSRAKFETGRRSYFANLDGKFKEAKGIKVNLTEQAEALVARGGQAAAEYRKLQDQWKASPKAGKAEESLWTKFRAAGDAIFAAKKATDSELASSQTGNLKAKLDLIDQAEKIDTSDLESAKKQLGEIQTKWVKVGHVAKEEVRKVEDRLRKVEKKIADAQAEAWRRSDPAAKARSNSLVSQLETAILGLEAELAAAPAVKQKELKEQIAARQAWLEAAQKAVD
ncbi:DUF349 domain-containing protein [Candidatus Aquiluna sp. UB-MaderosW2red]|uniref:DUF349 domain-containing protein n=1 Tax=Candidatus Aquiluna sp. UB-MaderosW2red TaxID=1855377 RepID=UPI000875BD2F|nr:DUF349 domain-containing protein [Candidatus Aquiluna sp. UB-MaderosW2red]SCX11499.1 protein of unknown function [Candidatus Aquiluna sp. UB-MaderosW2red]